MESLEGFWNDAGHASKIQKEKAILQETYHSYIKLKTVLEDFELLCEYGSSGDEDSMKEAIELKEKCDQLVNEVEQKAMLSGETDPNNAIITINAGAGGTESCDWASMLHRMLTRWAEKKKYKTTVMDFQYGDSAGIKSATVLVEGAFAYGNLKSESGVHRLVRISPFDSNARRHTSFSSVYVTAEIDDSIEIEINDADVRIDVYRSSGAGGQSVNTTDSAVRLTHMPSGIVVACQNERSQLQNKLTAFKILKSRLYEKAMEEKRMEQDALEAQKKEIAWGSQIRSYVLHPYKMVKDHRTGYQMGQADAVLEGELDGFIRAFLQWNANGQIITESTDNDI